MCIISKSLSEGWGGGLKIPNYFCLFDFKLANFKVNLRVPDMFELSQDLLLVLWCVLSLRSVFSVHNQAEASPSLPFVCLFFYSQTV